MNEAVRKFTPQQEAAINYRAGTLLVSSAAGSGKTMVLVERLLSYIEQGYNIDQFLVITYTRAAASQLRERIFEQLQKRLAGNPGNMHLRRQSMLCRGANIDTIHTFCSLTLRDNAHLTGLPPDFRIADEDECKMIRSDVLDDVFNRTYERINELPGLPELLEMYIDSRDDKKLTEIVEDIHTKLKSTPEPERWINDHIEEIRQQKGITDISQTKYGKYLLEVLYERAYHCYTKMLALQSAMEIHPDFKDKYGDSVSEVTDFAGLLAESLKKGWDEAVKHAKPVSFKAGRISGYDGLKAIRTWCVKELEKITGYLNISSSEHQKDAEKSAQAIETLLSIVLEFDRQYIQEKRKRGIADFSDLEHLTLSLLHEPQTGEKTAIAKSVSNRYKEILIDEYQDINEVQEKIFNALSQDGNNIFMVGDVKQSIYRFRLAEPEIFLKKYNDFDTLILNGNENSNISQDNPGSEASPPVKSNLTMNFRSQPGVLEMINHVFRNIMSVTLGEIDYAKAEELIPGRIKQGKQGKQGIAGNDEKRGVPVEIDILSMSSLPESDEETPKAVQLEAEYVAKKIKELHDEPHMIENEDGTFRAIRYSDIAILSRSVKGIIWRYANELNNIGIPSDISNSEEYFDQTEIKTVLSLLSVIDNPMQDIELASLLCGPVYNFTSDELAEIRFANKNMNYYDALKRSAEPGTVSGTIACKCKEVLSDIEQLRTMVYDLPADRFIWNAYNRTEIIKKVIAMKGGEIRKNNLVTLAGLAQKYEQSGYKGLFGFLRYIERLRAGETDINTNQIASGDNDAVKIMSIHKSKGLEFPAVFLVNTSKKHNTMDLRKPVVFHKALGIGGMITDSDKRIRYTTLARTAITEKLKSEMLSEELRVLYVAMTRAMEKLIITATFKDAEKVCEKIKLLADENGRYPPQALMSLNSIAEWLIAATANIPDKTAAINKIDLGIAESGNEISNRKRAVPEDDTAAGDIPTAPDYKPKQFTFEYPYETAINLPSKLTVTGLKKIIDPEAETAKWVKDDDSKERQITGIPQFISESMKLSAAQRGTIIHDVLRYIDFDKCSTEDEMRKCLQQLAERELIDEKALEETDAYVSRITAFIKSDLGIRIKNAAKSGTLKREFKYSLLTPAEKYFNDGGKDEILVQGIIDCYFEENGQLVVVDYKTDNINDDGVNERAKKYTLQLNEYSEALQRITGKEVKERIVYFVANNTSVNV